MNMMYLSLAIVVISGAVLVGILGYYLYKKRTLLIEDEHHHYADEPQFYQTRTTTLDQQNYGQSAFAASTNMQDKTRFSTLDLFEDQKLQQQTSAQLDDDSDYEDDLEEDILEHDDYSTYSEQQDAYYPQDAEPVHYAQEAAAATTVAHTYEEQHTKRQSSLDPEEELLVVYVLAEPGQPFVGYELLQALLSSGLRYGEMNIFHRFERAHGRGTPLFSLASASEPGTFDLNKMGEVSCRGLCLFMHLSDVKDPIIAFERMIDTANQLVEDLGGEVRDARGQVFNNDRLIDYRERVRDYVVTSHSKQLNEAVA